MRLNELKPKERAVITSHDIDVIKPTTLGLVVGTQVKCLSSMHTAMEIGFYGTRLAISKHTASKYGCRKLDD